MLKKILFLLTTRQKKEAFLLIFLLLIGIALEMAGIGLIVPAISLLIDFDNFSKLKYFDVLYEFIGRPSQTVFVVYGLIFLIFIYFVKTVYLIYLTYRQSRFTMYLSSDLSNRLFLGYLKLAYSFHLNRNSAELLRNIQTEVNQFTTLSQAFVLAISEFSVLLSVLILLIFIEPFGALSVSFFLGVTTFIFYFLTKKRILDWGQRRQFHDGEANRFLIEGLMGVKEIKFSYKEDFFQKKFYDHSMGKANVFTNQTTLLQAPRFYLEFLGLIGLSILIMILLLQTNSVTNTFPIIGLFVAAAFRLIPSANRIINSLQVIRSCKPVIELLFNEFKIVYFNTIPEKNNFDFRLVENIKLENLYFSYEEKLENTLAKLNLEIRFGEIIGIIGFSGSGKSTLVDIILGLLDPTDGRVLVNGIDIRESKYSWRKNIGYVPQNIFLIDDTLKNNIAFGIPENEICYDSLSDSIEAAQLGSFIENLPLKLSTVIGEGGVRLSGGQRQRIGIARALYKKPSILILDEATSALDTSTELDVMNSIYKLKSKITIIIVAHRLSTLEKCDRIIKIENGSIVSLIK